MRAYQTIRFIEFPDIGDIKEQGRKSSVGRIPRGSMYFGRIVRNDRGYMRPTVKAGVRRTLKRADKARALRTELED